MIYEAAAAREQEPAVVVDERDEAARAPAAGRVGSYKGPLRSMCHRSFGVVRS